MLYCPFVYLPVHVFTVSNTQMLLSSSFFLNKLKFQDQISLGFGWSIGCECYLGLMKRGQHTVCTCGTWSTLQTQFLHLCLSNQLSALYVIGSLAFPVDIHVKYTVFPLFLLCILLKPLKSCELGQLLLSPSPLCRELQRTAFFHSYNIACCGARGNL